MGRHNLSPAWQFTIAVILIGSLVAGVGIALGMTAGTYDRPTWIPQGSSGDLGTVNWSKFYANPKYTAEMVIITSPELVSALQPLAQWKTEKGTPCIINTTENISATYPGRDLPEQIRNCLRDLYYNGSLEWVLLAGNSTTVPPRYVYNDDTVQVPANELEDQHGQTDLYYKPTDFYYSALAGTWDANGNGIFGESANVTKTTDEIIWTPNVYVGRFPANSYAEMQGLVDKTIKYETYPPIGTWMQNMVLGGIISDPSPRNNDEAYVVQKIADTDVPSTITKTILLQTTAAYTPNPNVNNITSGQFGSALAAGASLAHFEGHGNYYELASSSGTVMDTGGAGALPNNDQLTFFYTAACDSAAFDLYPTSTLMYALLVPQDRGAIGYIGAMRVSWYFDLSVEQEAGHWLESLNRGLAQAFWQNFFINGTHQPGKALADAKLTYINSAWASFQNESNAATNGFFGMEYERKELLSFTLFGDPELNVYTQEPKDFSIALPATVYGGEEIQAPIRDTAGYSVPGATVCFQSADGLYYNSTHLGTSTNLDVRVPILNNSESYNVTITGPNMLPYVFSMTEKPDTGAPQVLAAPTMIVHPLPTAVGEYTVDGTFNFTTCVQDTQSGIGVVALHLSYDNFATVANYTLEKTSGNDYSVLVSHLPPGTASYYFVAKDCAGNVVTIRPDGGGYFTFTVISLPVHYVIVSLGLSAGAVGVIAFSIAIGRKWRAWKKEPMLENRVIDFGNELGIEPREIYDFA